ncbi:MAG TPA: GFA family protein [Gaiellaceae bacterium]|nr:GFA family protein [Gaiellaceae bacterium]
MKGSCFCGAVQFEVAGPFINLGFCHCTTCKKISGGGGTANGRARTEDVSVLQGRESIVTFQPYEGTAKSFCRLCGSNLFGGGWPKSEHASVRLSAIDSGLNQKPDAHTFVRSVAPWETLPDDGLPRYETGRP